MDARPIELAFEGDTLVPRRRVLLEPRSTTAKVDVAG